MNIDDFEKQLNSLVKKVDTFDKKFKKYESEMKSLKSKSSKKLKETIEDLKPEKFEIPIIDGTPMKKLYMKDGYSHFKGSLIIQI